MYGGIMGNTRLLCRKVYLVWGIVVIKKPIKINTRKKD